MPVVLLFGTIRSFLFGARRPRLGRGRRLVLAVSLALIAVTAGASSQLALAQPEAGSQERSVNGTFSILYGDPPQGSGMQHQYRYFVADDAGLRYQVNISEAVAAAGGGLVNLDRRRVTVTGVVSLRSPAPPLINATSIRAFGAAEQSSGTANLAGPQAFATILCRFGDEPNVTPQTAAWATGLMGDVFPGIGDFWRENSFNQINNLGSAVQGWYNLPSPRSTYVVGNSFNGSKAALDCTALADPYLNFNNFVGINLFFNDKLDGYNWGGPWSGTLDGTSKNWPTTWESPSGFSNQATLAHEMGHAYGLPHSSGGYGTDYDSGWDVMSGGGWKNGSPDPTYGILGTNTIAYHKDRLGWIPANRKYTAPPNTCKQIAINGITRIPAPPGAYLMAKISAPTTAAPNRFYTVEARRNEGYDKGRIPGEAIVIHEVDELRSTPAHVVDATVNNDPNDAGAMWLPGEVFNDTASQVNIAVVSSTPANGWLVRIQRGLIQCTTLPGTGYRSGGGGVG